MPEPTNVLGLDIGGTSIKAGFFPRLGRRVLAWQTIPTAKTKLAFWRNLVSLVDWYREHYEVRAIGVGCPGPINLARGTVVRTGHLPLKNFPLGPKLAQVTGLPVAFDNDANAFTLAEAVLGAGRKYHNVVGLTLGTGVGGGIVMGERVYHGRSNAGELGHLLIDRFGKAGIHGYVGALESYLGAGELITIARRHGLQINSVKDLAQTKGRATNIIWNDFGTTLGYALGSFTQVLDPDIFVIGGQIAKAWPRFANGLRTSFRRSYHISPPKITQALLGDQAGVIGAALLTKHTHAHT